MKGIMRSSTEPCRDEELFGVRAGEEMSEELLRNHTVG